MGNLEQFGIWKYNTVTHGKDQYMRNKMKAYFTVEAALVMPVSFICILLVIYLWFFQYDRCLVEIDTNAAVMRALVAEAVDNNERMDLIKNYLNEIYDEKYVAWNDDATTMKIARNKICVEREGSVRFPFSFLTPELVDGNQMWSVQSKVKADIMDPAFIVRSIRKLKGEN